MNWIFFALLSAAAAGATAVLAKVGVKDIPSNLATAIRTLVILAFSWGIVFARGEQSGLREVRGRPLVFLMLSGIATGVSWLAYYRALQLAPASRVAPLDKLSLPITILLAALLLAEPMSPRLLVGVALMVIGAIVTVGA
jgi:bacterial/archaeal transporter family protein